MAVFTQASLKKKKKKGNEGVSETLKDGFTKFVQVEAVFLLVLAIIPSQSSNSVSYLSDLFF